jgi:hypothetical protein
MPSSIPYSSILPKFPDKQRRPGIIQLPQALPKSGNKQSALNGISKHATTPDAVLKSKPQLPTPSPSPASRSKSQQGSRRKQKRSSIGNIMLNNGDNSVENVVSEKAVAPLSVNSATSGPIILSPPPTPAQRATKKASPSSTRSKSKNRAAGHARQSSKILSLPVSPPLTPEAFKFPPVAVEEAVFAPLLPPINLAQDMSGSDDSLPLAEDDEVIVWKQPQTPTFAMPAPKQRVLSTPSRTPSPLESFKWEDVKNLPRLSPATVAQLKEQYDIRPSEAFQHQKNYEPDLLMSLLHSSPSSCPPTPGASPDRIYATPSKPIAIGRRPNGASHVRAPSFPAYPPSGRLAMMQYKEDVAEAFGLDVRDELAVQKATEAWRAYAGSTFNNSPETERVPPPKFLGRLFL